MIWGRNPTGEAPQQLQLIKRVTVHPVTASDNPCKDLVTALPSGVRPAGTLQDALKGAGPNDTDLVGEWTGSSGESKWVFRLRANGSCMVAEIKPNLSLLRREGKWRVQDGTLFSTRNQRNTRSLREDED